MKPFAKKEKKQKDPLLQTYFVSLLSLVLCVAMFLGTTFAWFSSDVTSQDNQIFVGTLSVKLSHWGKGYTEWKTVDASEKILDPDIRWEPGYTTVEWLKLENTGDLALNYRLKMASTAANAETVLAAIGQYFTVYANTAATYEKYDGEKNFDEAKPTNFQDLISDENWVKVGTLAEVMAGKSIVTGQMDPKAKDATENPVVQFAVAIHMAESTPADPEIMGKNLENISVKLEAWQDNKEEDVFGADYDHLITSAEDLKAAFMAGGDAILMEDVDMGEGNLTLTKGKTLTLNLNGHDVSGQHVSGETSLVYVQNTAVLNIRDLSETADGSITYHSGKNGAEGDTIQVDGELNLYSGTINLTGSWSLGFAVDVRPNAWGAAYEKATLFHMYGGKIVSSDSTVRVASSSASTYQDVSASFVMDGGELDSAWDAVLIQQSDAAYDVLSVTISGGKIAGDVSTIRILAPAATSVVNNSAKPMTVTVNGGTFDYTGTKEVTWQTKDVLCVAAQNGATAEDVLAYAEITIDTDKIVVETPSDQ